MITTPGTARPMVYYRTPVAAVGDLLARAGARPDRLELAADPGAVLHGALLHGPGVNRVRASR